MQLSWPAPIRTIKIRERGGIETFMRRDDESCSTVCRTKTGWRVCGMLAASALNGESPSLAGQSWEISCGRYDYMTLSEKPTTSSTSLHVAPSFHRRFEWSRVHFTNPPPTSQNGLSPVAGKLQA